MWTRLSILLKGLAVKRLLLLFLTPGQWLTVLTQLVREIRNKFQKGYDRWRRVSRKKKGSPHAQIFTIATSLCFLHYLTIWRKLTSFSDWRLIMALTNCTFYLEINNRTWKTLRLSVHVMPQLTPLHGQTKWECNVVKWSCFGFSNVCSVSSARTPHSLTIIPLCL